MKDNHVIKSELLLQILKPSTYLIIILFILLNVYISKIMHNEILFRIEQHSLGNVTSSSFPPCINSFMLMEILMGSTIFTIIGGLIVRYDCNNKCLWMRATTFGYSNVMVAKVLWGGILSFIISVLSIVAGYINQVYLLRKYFDHVYEFSNSNIRALLGKLVAMLLVLLISYMCGMIIGNNIHNTGITVVLCFLLDQFVLAKSWLYTVYVYRQFSDVNLMVSAPRAYLSDISYILIALGIFTLVAIVYIIAIKIYRIIIE